MRKLSFASIEEMTQRLNQAGIKAKSVSETGAVFEYGAITKHASGLPVVQLEFDVTHQEIKAVVDAVHGAGIWAISDDAIVLDNSEPQGFLSLASALKKFRHKSGHRQQKWKCRNKTG